MYCMSSTRNPTLGERKRVKCTRRSVVKVGLEPACLFRFSCWNPLNLDWKFCLIFRSRRTTFCSVNNSHLNPMTSLISRMELRINNLEHFNFSLNRELKSKMIRNKLSVLASKVSCAMRRREASPIITTQTLNHYYIFEILFKILESDYPRNRSRCIYVCMSLIY